MLEKEMNFMKSFIEALKYAFKDKGSRAWSNQELKKFAHLFKGDIVNVSAWEDKDKEGDKYEDYFVNKKSYTITNYGGKRGTSGLLNEIYLDLEKPLPPELKRKFDVVFNHTTLEHIFDIFSAFKNLCELSKDVVILVVPFIQEIHECPGSYSDFWRPTHLAIEKLFEKNGFKVLYGSSNNIPPIYHFFIASRNPAKWKNVFKYDRSKMNSGNYIRSFMFSLCRYLVLPFKRPKYFIKRLISLLVA